MTIQSIDPARTSLEAQMRYAEVLAASNLLPKAYRDQPANVLLAAQLGEALGIPTIQAINSIHVIDGRPSAGADLIASIVRRAGHRLRVAETKDREGPVVTATLIRADDPDFGFVAQWNIAKARAAGLLAKENWKKYPGQMMRNRAVMEVCRMGASDAMYGVNYDPEELEGIQIPSADRDWRAETDAAGTVTDLAHLWSDAHRAHALDDDLRAYMQARKQALLDSESAVVDVVVEEVDAATGEVLATVPASPAPSPAKRVTLSAILRELDRCGVTAPEADAYMPVLGLGEGRLRALTQSQAIELLDRLRELDRDGLAAMVATCAQEGGRP